MGIDRDYIVNSSETRCMLAADDNGFVTNYWHDADGLTINYSTKYMLQQQAVRNNYATFAFRFSRLYSANTKQAWFALICTADELPYNGTDNNNYVDGQGFCCVDGSFESTLRQNEQQESITSDSEGTDVMT